ncbi:MAG: hypothetical protein H6618_05350 [Deltaproteobacteria bacterium]|nr:hypothetical protein [Deltaproteobacteria bacterium]
MKKIAFILMCLYRSSEIAASPSSADIEFGKAFYQWMDSKTQGQALTQQQRTQLEQSFSALIRLHPGHQDQDQDPSSRKKRKRDEQSRLEQSFSSLILHPPGHQDQHPSSRNKRKEDEQSRSPKAKTTIAEARGKFTPGSRQTASETKVSTTPITNDYRETNIIYTLTPEGAHFPRFDAENEELTTSQINKILNALINHDDPNQPFYIGRTGDSARRAQEHKKDITNSTYNKKSALFMSSDTTETDIQMEGVIFNVRPDQLALLEGLIIRLTNAHRRECGANQQGPESAANDYWEEHKEEIKKKNDIQLQGDHVYTLISDSQFVLKARTSQLENINTDADCESLLAAHTLQSDQKDTVRILDLSEDEDEE